MARVFKKGIPLTIAWTLTKPDGSSFDLTGYDHRLFYGVGNRYTQVSGTAVTGNVVSWTFPASEQRTAEDYSLKLMLYQNSRLFTTLVYNKAFSFLNGAIAGQREEQQNETASVVHLYSAVEFYLFQPVVPTVGEDGYWYANGAKVVDADGNNVLADHTLDYDEDTNALIIDRDRVDASGNPIQQVVPLQVGIESVTQVQTSSDPSGVNKVRVTLTNGYTSDFVVTNGVGITGITENLSPNDGGTNDIIITFSNGQSATVHTKNGSQGNSGYTGAAGELEVVNNLVDGGATAALSAQQGKTLKGMIQDADIFIHGLEKNINVGFITNSNTFNAIQGSGVCIYVNGISKATITKKTGSAAKYYALLKTNVYDTGTLSFSDEVSTRQEVVSGADISIPSDCNYLWLCFGLSDTVFNPDDTVVRLDDYLLSDFISNYDLLMDNSVSYTKAMNNVDGAQANLSDCELVAGKDYTIVLDTWDATTQNASKIAFAVSYKVGDDRYYAVAEYSGSDLSGKSYSVSIPSNATSIIVGGRANNSVKISVYDMTTPSLKTLLNIINGDSPSTNPDDIFNLDTTLAKNRMFSDKDMFDMESYWFILDEYLEDKYWSSEKTVVNNFINKFRARAGAGKYQIGVISDTHGVGAYTFRTIANTNYTSCIRSIAIFNKIMAYCNAGIHGGDIACDYGTSYSRDLAYIRSVLRKFRFNKPFFITKGNHDENNNGYAEADMMNIQWQLNNYYTRSFSTFTQVTQDTWDGSDLYVGDNALVTDTEFANIAQHWLSPSGAVWGNGAYYYYDIADSKIRMIVANSFPVNESRIYDEREEYNWFAGTALDFSDKATPSDWKVIILRHTQSTGISTLSGCINAFQTGGTWTYDGTTHNFSTINGGGMTVIAHIHGHEHGNCFSNGSGYFDIGENASFSSRLGDATTYGISVWTIDTTNQKVYEDTIDGKTWVYNYAAASGRLEIKRGDSFTAAKSGVSGTVTVSCSEPTILISGQSVTIGNSTPLGNYTVTVTGSTSGSYNYLIKVVESYS